MSDWLLLVFFFVVYVGATYVERDLRSRDVRTPRKTPTAVLRAPRAGERFELTAEDKRILTAMRIGSVR